MQNHLVCMHFQAQQSEQTTTAGAQSAVKGATCNIWASDLQASFGKLPQAKKSWTPSLSLLPLCPLSLPSYQIKSARLCADLFFPSAPKIHSFREDKNVFGKRGFAFFKNKGL